MTTTRSEGNKNSENNERVSVKKYSMATADLPFKFSKGFTDISQPQRWTDGAKAILTVPLQIEDREIQRIIFEIEILNERAYVSQELMVSIKGFEGKAYHYNKSDLQKHIEVVIPKGLTGDLEIQFETPTPRWVKESAPNTLVISFKAAHVCFMPASKLLNPKSVSSDREIESKISNLMKEVKTLQGNLQGVQIEHAKKEEQLNLQIKELNAKVKTGQEIFDEAFLKAAEQGDIKKIKSALNLNANVQAENKLGQTAFHLSVLGAHREAADFISTKELSLFLEPDNDGYTPIESIAAAGRLDMLDWLYEKGKSIPEFFNNQEHFDELYRVASAEAKIFLANKKLFDSIKIGNVEGVRDALKKGAQVNTKGEDGETAIFKSVYLNHVEITQLLLDNNADPTIRSTFEGNQLSALDIAKKGTNSDSISTISTSFLINAAHHGNQDDMILALKSDANLIGTNNDGQIALHKAVLAGNIDTIKFLLKKHAEYNFDIHIEDNKGNTPYQLAKQLNLKIKTKHGEKLLETYMLEKYGSYKKEFKLLVKTTELSNSPFCFIATVGGKTKNETSENAAHASDPVITQKGTLGLRFKTQN